ncbi:cholinesterase-like isoform X2 [Dermacentor albipictus]|uniref:cholinesterase-like isoform X2 n=1 Tax=Dermacentor albipictus TaxID=60249 RepID=UPI0038FD064B
MPIRIRNVMMPLVSTAMVIGIAMAVADPVVVTENGSIQGTRLTMFNGTSVVDAYLGIPYAAPPVGELRFKKSIPPIPWEPYTLQAKKKSPACMQFAPANPLPPWVSTESEQSEDCLYLNVWTPQEKRNGTENLRNVMVWIHGGGFNFGSASMDVYDGAVLAALEDVVVVSMNYRLGIFGFLALPNDETPAAGNQGLLDQVLALRWIQENIVNFGGDPMRVTLFGESAGGWSIAYHAISPLARMLFHRGIVQSAGILVQQLADPFNVAELKAMQVADSVGCSAKFNVTNVVGCLQNKTAHHLAIMESIVCTQFIMCFTAVYGDEYLPHDPVTAADVSVPKQFLLGNVENEGSVFASLWFWMQFPFHSAMNIGKTDMVYFFLKTFSFMPEFVTRAVFNLYVGTLRETEYTELRTEFGHAIGDAFLRCPEVFFGEKLSQHNSNVYYYNMVYHSATATHLDPWFGLTHFEDVQYVFGMPLRDRPPKNYSLADAEFSRYVMNIWVTFSKTGVPPMVDGDAWPLFDSKDHKVVSLDHNHTHTETLRQLDRCRFWASLFKPNLKSGLSDCL